MKHLLGLEALKKDNTLVREKIKLYSRLIEE